MKDADPGIRLCVGVSGAGKTRETKREVFHAALGGVPVIVIDRVTEWPERLPDGTIVVPGALSKCTAIVSSVSAATRAIDGGARLAVVQVDQENVAREAELACKWAAEKGPNRTRRDTTRGVAIPEAHRVLPNTDGGGLIGGSKHFDEVITAWRHCNAAVWLDTQRFARLSRTAVEQAGVIRVFAVGARDVGAIAEDFVERQYRAEFSAALREAGRRMKPKDKGGDGEPGWHLIVEQSSVEPPFELRREKA